MGASASQTETASVGDYLGWLVRRWWVVAIAVIVCGLAGAGYGATQPKSFISETKVLVLPVGEDSSAKVNLDTEAQVVKSLTVAQIAGKLLASAENPADLVGRVSVTVPPNTSVLTISYEGATGVDAQLGSQAFAQAYLDHRSAEAVKDIEAEIASLQEEIAGLTSQLNTVTAQIITTVANSVERQRAVQAQTILTTQIGTLNSRMAPLLAATIKPGSILSPANKPDRPDKPNEMLYLASGLAIGLLFGLAGALVLDKLDTRVYSSKQLPEHGDVPVLLEVRRGRDKNTVADAASSLGREFSLLRNMLRVAAGAARGGRPSPTDVLLICGAVPGSATGFVVGNLAAAFARAGERVIIVCTDPTSSLPTALGVYAEVGLGEVLAGEVTLADALQLVPPVRGVSLLAPGRIDPRVELPVAAVSDLLVRLQQQADRVLLATAPPSHAVDAQALSEAAAAVLLVVEAKSAHIEEVETAIEQFARVQAPLAGMLVVRDQRSRRSRNQKPIVPAVAAPARITPSSGYAGQPAGSNETVIIPRIRANSERDGRPEALPFWEDAADGHDKTVRLAGAPADETVADHR